MSSLRTFSLQFLKGVPREWTTNLQPLRDDRRGDELVAGYLLVQLVVRSLVEQYQIVEFIANFALGPLLLTAHNNTNICNRRQQLNHLRHTLK